MKFLPIINPSLGGVWIFVILYLVILGLIMKSVSKNVRSRLYDTSSFGKRYMKISKSVKIFFLIDFIILTLVPIEFESIEFIVGLVLYVMGFTTFGVAIFYYARTRPNTPVTKGIYRYSRNPQILGLNILFIGINVISMSVLLIIIGVIGIIGGHFRIITEEKQCLLQYGESYQKYMEKVPRYFILF